MAEKKTPVGHGTGKKQQQQLTGQHSFQKDRYGRAGQSHGSESMNWREPNSSSSNSSKSFSPQMFHSPSSTFSQYKDMPPSQDHIDNVAFLSSRWQAIPSELKRTPTRQMPSTQ
uniref:Uncharacterized protein n=1 Tax=Amphimedon queenslandica TaxID=400682 RepID=A0A1X7V6U9_AMPQE